MRFLERISFWGMSIAQLLGPRGCSAATATTTINAA